jgi:hypothetical protein
VCRFVPGWFSDTVATEISESVALAYIDCDLAKGTEEVIRGVLPHLKGAIVSQDFHIAPVQALLRSAEFWHSVGTAMPRIEQRGRRLAVISYSR